jgi:hypothetical protein
MNLPIKNQFGKLAAAMLGFATLGSASAGTLNWGDAVFDTLYDSYGVPLDDTFYFQLGFFENSFVPTSDNTSEWKLNWRVFDQAYFNLDLSYYTSTTEIRSDGSSSSPYALNGANFAGQVAYLWVRNSDDAVHGSEWFLARHETWVFPSASAGCCDNELPVEWSLSDLDHTEVPVWGAQDGTIGAGKYTITGDYALQTFRVAPEPSSVLMAACAGVLTLLRRRRMP